jgi:Fumarylacetoacetate (FAA) hydrolase family
MKYQLFTYLNRSGDPKTGLALGAAMFDLEGVCAAADEPRLGRLSVDALLEDWPRSHAALKRVAERLSGTAERFGGFNLDPAKVQFAPPLLRPGTIYAAGANYRDHVEAMAKAFNMKLALDPRAEGVPPWHFIKAARGTLSGHRQPVVFPGHTKMLDWEAELAVIIGRRCARLRRRLQLRQRPVRPRQSEARPGRSLVAVPLRLDRPQVLYRRVPARAVPDTGRIRRITRKPRHQALAQRRAEAGLQHVQSPVRRCRADCLP